MNVQLDPYFDEYITAPLAPSEIVSAVTEQCSGSLAGVTRTEFDLHLPAGRAAEVLPLDDALLSLDIPVSNTHRLRSLVIQQNNVLLCATLETGGDTDRMRGEFFTGDDVFTIDALSEICADNSLKSVRNYVAETVAALVGPIASPDTAAAIAQTLAPRLSPAMAQRFGQTLKEQLERHHQG